MEGGFPIKFCAYETLIVGFLRGVVSKGRTLSIPFGKIGEPNREDERGITTSH